MIKTTQDKIDENTQNEENRQNTSADTSGTTSNVTTILMSDEVVYNNTMAASLDGSQPTNLASLPNYNDSTVDTIALLSDTDEATNPHLKRVRIAKEVVGNLKSAILTFILGAFTKPSFASLVLLTAGPPLFITVAAIEAIEFGLTLTESIMDGSIRTHKGAAHVVFEALKTASILTAVTGAVVAAPIFNVAILGLSGGLTPLLFTGTLACAAAVSFVDAGYNYYKFKKEPDQEKKAVYLNKAKKSLVQGVALTALTVATGCLMLNPVTGPVMVGIAVTTIVVMAGVMLFNNRQHIRSAYRKLKDGFPNLKRRLTRANSTEALQEESIENQEKNNTATNDMQATTTSHESSSATFFSACSADKQSSDDPLQEQVESRTGLSV